MRLEPAALNVPIAATCPVKWFEMLRYARKHTQYTTLCVVIFPVANATIVLR